MISKKYININKAMLGLLLSLMVAACGTEKANDSDDVILVQRTNDKLLSCKDIQLEINEAEFLRKQTMQSIANQSYVESVSYDVFGSSDEEVIAKCNARIKYLQSIYNEKNCKD